MRCAIYVLALNLMSSAVLAVPTAAIAQSDDAPLATNFSVTAKTLIPGSTISPGDYTISVVEHLTDRVILRVADKDGKVKSMFLGLTSTGLPASGGSGPILWTGKGESVLRGFSFPGAPPVEFVYPKAQAVTIANNNSGKVLAIDPASDNLSVTHDNLSKQDMQIVTLWTLRSTRVGPGTQSGIEAARYQVPTPAADQTVAPVQVARATPPPPLRAAPAPKAVVTATDEHPAPAVRKHAIAALPHTASNLPEVLLGSILALVGAAILRLRRKGSLEV